MYRLGNTFFVKWVAIHTHLILIERFQVAYKIILFNTIDGKYALYLHGSNLRIIDRTKSIKLGRTQYIKMYKIDQLGCFNGYLIDFNEKFAYILSICSTLEQAISYIESSFSLV